MKRTAIRLGGILGRLHRDERGAEMLEILLIVAAIALPLLGLLIWFRNDIRDWVGSIWESQKDEAEQWDNAP